MKLLKDWASTRHAVFVCFMLRYLGACYRYSGSHGDPDRTSCESAAVFASHILRVRYSRDHSADREQAMVKAANSANTCPKVLFHTISESGWSL